MKQGLGLVDTCAWIDFFRNASGMLGSQLALLPIPLSAAPRARPGFRCPPGPRSSRTLPIPASRGGTSGAIGNGRGPLGGYPWRRQAASQPRSGLGGGGRSSFCLMLGWSGRVQPLDFQGVRFQRLDKRTQFVQCSPATGDASPRRVVECPCSGLCFAPPLNLNVSSFS